MKLVLYLLLQLINKHYKNGDLLKIARKMESNNEKAQELLHCTVERCLDKKHLYKNRNFLGFFKTVMLRILTNQKRDYALHARHDEVYTQLNSITPCLENDLHYKMIFDDVSKIFDEKHTTVLFYKLNEYQSKEICDVIGGQKNAIDGRYYRVKQRIKKRYRNEIKL